MGVGSIRIYRNLGFLLLTGLLLVVLSISILTYEYRDSTAANPLYMFAINHHIAIIVVLVIVSVGYGFLWSTISASELEKNKQDTKKVLDVVLMFLGQEEKEILNFLVSQGGETSQAEISRLQHMDRVKAYRSLQKMEEKNLVEITAHGKIRRVRLKEHILHLLE